MVALADTRAGSSEREAVMCELCTLRTYMAYHMYGERVNIPFQVS